MIRRQLESICAKSNLKRSSEVPVEELEREMRLGQEGVASCMVSFHNCETGNDIHMPLSSFVEQAFQVTSHVPLLSGLLDSVQFAPNATSVVMPFGKRSHLRLETLEAQVCYRRLHFGRTFRGSGHGRHGQGGEQLESDGNGGSFDC